jgi:hypothetical protein
MLENIVISLAGISRNEALSHPLEMSNNRDCFKSSKEKISE